MESTATNSADPGRESTAARGNRRCRVRHKVHTPAYAALSSCREIPAIELQEIVNISEDGVALQLATPLQLQEKIDFCLDLTATDAMIDVRGQVAWLDSGKAGIHFSDLPAESQQKLQQWLFANAMAACEYQFEPAGELPPSSDLGSESLQPAQLVPDMLTVPAPFLADYTATLAALEAVEREIAAAADLDHALQLIAERAMVFTRATGAAIALAAEHDLICRAIAGPDAPSLGMHFKAGEGFSGECIRTGQTLRCDDTETDSRVDAESCRALGVRSMIATPIRGPESVLGLLEVLSPLPHSFHNQDEAALQRLAEMVSNSLYFSRLHGETSSAAIVSVVDDEIYNESQADAANHGISATHKLLLLVAALTLMAALAWLFVPSSGSKGAPRQDQHPPPPASQPVVSHTAPEDFSVLRQLAEKGDPVAQFAVGAHFATGEDVPQDYAEAMRWFTMAAEQGHVGAQATLGAYYWSGRGAPQDLSKAYFWAFLAQSAGDDASRYRVTFLTSRMTHAQVVAAQQRADEWLKSHQTASTAVSQQTAQRD